MYFDKGGRHFWFAEFLQKKGYDVTIFCASTVHNTDMNVLTNNEAYIVKKESGITFVFIKTPQYEGNGFGRVKNMIHYTKNLRKVTKQFSKRYGPPSCIYASSVHPLTLFAGIRLAKKYKVRCVCEIRDLWPESLVEYGYLKKSSILTKLLYQGEKWIYKKADKLIFTMEGGKKYILDKGWGTTQGGPIDLNKVFHINNGVHLEQFNHNKQVFQLEDEDLDNPNTFKVLYTGSLRESNFVLNIVKIAEIILKKGYPNIKFIFFGRGPEEDKMKEYCLENKVTNVKVKGFVEKKYIPSILSKSNLNLIVLQQDKLKQYGASLNKMFEYFASGKPTLSNCLYDFDLIEKYHCGKALLNPSEEQIADMIIHFSKMSKEEYENYCKNAEKAAKDYDFKKLTDDLEQILFA